MAQTQAGARRWNANRLGLTVEQYDERIAAGEAWCGGCRAWHAVDAFGPDSSRPDGRARVCRAARGVRRRELYVPVPPDQRRPMGPGPRFYTEATRLKMAAARAKRRGKPSPLRGQPRSPEVRAKISAAVRKSTPRGAACHSYKDGRVAERRGERFSAAYKRWRFDVMARDRFTCRTCGDDRGGNLVAHHVRGFADHPELRLDVTNGLTLCRPCHEAHHKEHGYG